MKLLTVLLFFAMISLFNAQVKSNYEIILEMVPETITEVAQASGDRQGGILITLPPGSSILSSRVLSSALEVNKNIISGTFEDKINIIYTLEKIDVNYGEVFHRGFPGDYLCERKIKLSGINIIDTDKKANSFPFEVTRTDTIKYDEIKLLEQGVSFARGEKPEEPFFRSWVEPAIAVTAAIVTVYLFFDVRSK